jgi:hypothetical protein
MPKGIKKKTKEKSAAGPLDPNRGSSTSKLGTASQRLAFKLASGLFKVVDCDEEQPPGNFGIRRAWAVVPHNVKPNGKPRLAAEFGRDFVELGFRRPRDGADCVYYLRSKYDRDGNEWPLDPVTLTDTHPAEANNDALSVLESDF